MSTDLRVLMTADAVGGVWTYALELARACRAHGVVSTIATMGPPPSPAQRAEAETIRDVQIVSGDFRLEWMDDPWDDVAAAGAWLLSLEQRYAPDVVHLNGYAHAALPWKAPTLVAAHSCVASWAEAVPHALSTAALDSYIQHVRAGLEAATLVVAPTHAMLHALHRIYGFDGPSAVVPNGRTNERLKPGRKEPFLFTAGRLWDRAKNIEAVTAVAPLLPWPVAIAGDERLDDGTTADARPALRGCRSLGRLDGETLADWLARASILVLPARYEPFGLVPLEAAMCGCALVLGDIPSLREVWGPAAEYVSPDRHDNLRDVVARLIASPGLLSAQSSAARARARAFSAEHMAQHYLTLYTQMAAASADAGRPLCAS